MTEPAREPLDEVLLGLKHPDESVRQRAALALGPMVTPDLAPRLAAQLWTDTDFFVRETLTWNLVRIGEAAKPYALVALRDERAQVRHDAAHLLGKIGDPSVLPDLAPLTADSDDAVAAKARFVLARLGDPAAIPVLVAYLGTGNDESRTELTRDIASFGQAAVTHLEKAVTHTDQSVREHAQWVLDVIREGEDGADSLVDLTLTRREPPESSV